MRLRHIKGAEEQIAESPYVIQDPQGLKGKWHEFFGNQNPIRIEVGMGKGKFIMELAEKNPDVNYIGIERYSSVLLRGLQKRSQLERPTFTSCGSMPWSWRTFLMPERWTGSI